MPPYRDDELTGQSTTVIPLEGALEAASRGWPVFPIGDRRNDHPFKAWQSIATTAPAQINEWWSINPLYDVGIACGPAGLIVITLDTIRRPISAEWASRGVGHGRDVIALAALDANSPDPTDTYTVLTPSGEDRYFLSPPGLRLPTTIGTSGFGIGPCVDVRAWGGSAIGAGSRRVVDDTAHTYSLDPRRPTEPRPLPDWITARLAPRTPRHGHPESPRRDAAAPRRTTTPGIIPVTDKRTSNYVAAAVRNETADIARASPRVRARTIFKAAAALGNLIGAGLLDETTAEAALLTAALRHHTISDRDVHDALGHIRNGIARGRTTPRIIATNAA